MANHLHGLLQNSNFTLIKVFRIHQNDVQIAEQLKKLEWVTAEAVEEEEEWEAVQDNLLKSPAQTAVQKIPYHSNQKAIDQFYAETVLDNRKVHNLSY